MFLSLLKFVYDNCFEICSAGQGELILTQKTIQVKQCIVINGGLCRSVIYFTASRALTSIPLRTLSVCFLRSKNKLKNIVEKCCDFIGGNGGILISIVIFDL